MRGLGRRQVNHQIQTFASSFYLCCICLQSSVSSCGRVYFLAVYEKSDYCSRNLCAPKISWFYSGFHIWCNKSNRDGFHWMDHHHLTTRCIWLLYLHQVHLSGRAPVASVPPPWDISPRTYSWQSYYQVLILVTMVTMVTMVIMIIVRVGSEVLHRVRGGPMENMRLAQRLQNLLYKIRPM